MDIEYMAEAMSRADIRFMMSDDFFYGVIRDCPGVSATGATHEECRRNLQDALDNWLFIRRATGLHIPRLGGVRPRTRSEAV